LNKKFILKKKNNLKKKLSDNHLITALKKKSYENTALLVTSMQGCSYLDHFKTAEK